MSTGDQTQYVRSKLAERGSHPGARFMRDGFDAWAESEAPARAGQMEKEPAEIQMANYGGAMTLKHAKKLQLDMGAMSNYSGGAMYGGADIIPEPVKKAVAEAKKLVQMWRDVSSWIDSFEADLRDEIIENPASQPNLVTFAKQLETMLNNVKVFKTVLDGVAAALGAVGAGRRSGKLKGGMAWQDVGTHVQRIAQIYMWFKNNKDNLEQVLKLKSLQPYGQQVLNAVLPIFSAVGMGRGGAFQSCEPGWIDDGLLCRKPIKCGGTPLRCEGGEVVPKKVRGGAFQSCEPGWIDDGANLCRKPLKCGGTPLRCEGGEVVPKKVRGGASCKLVGDPWKPIWDPGHQRMICEGSASGGAKKRGGAFQSCKPGWIDDGLLCRNPIKCTSPPLRCEGGEVLPKRRVGGASCGGRAPSARGAIVKQIMAEHGISLPQASKYVKEHGLY